MFKQCQSDILRRIGEPHLALPWSRPRSFPDLDLDFDDLGGSLTWTEPVDDQFVVAYNVYQALPLEDPGVVGMLVVLGDITGVLSHHLYIWLVVWNIFYFSIYYWE